MSEGDKPITGRDNPDTTLLQRKQEQTCPNVGAQPAPEVQPPPDVDQGWAFVVLLASFLCMFLVATITYATGVLPIALLERFHSDAAFVTDRICIHQFIVLHRCVQE